jgi:hypothetical protein
MLPNFIDVSNAVLDVIPNEGFLETTALFDIVATFSPDAADFVVNTFADLETATGELAIDAGVITGTLLSDTTEIIIDSFDVPTFIATDLRDILTEATGRLSLADGLVNATLQSGEDLFNIENFDLATFAADGLVFLLSAVDTTVPLENGAFLIQTETELGPINGMVDVADGRLDIDLDTFAGALNWSMDFGPEAVFPFEVPTDLGTFDALVNFDSGNLELPILAGTAIEIPLSSLSGDLQLSDGLATLSLDTRIGPVTTSFAIAETVNDLVIDTLTGLTVDANLTGGQLEVLSTSGTETFATVLDLVDLSAQLETALLETNGTLTLQDGLFTGVITVGQDTFPIAESVAELANGFVAPIGELIALPPTI